MIEVTIQATKLNKEKKKRNNGSKNIGQDKLVIKDKKEIVAKLNNK